MIKGEEFMAGQWNNVAGNNADKLVSLEEKLSGAFKTVTPRKEFVTEVAKHIHSGSRVNYVLNHVSRWHVFAMLAAGVISFFILMGVLSRWIATFSVRKRSA
jgi:hypothetical protein